MRVDLSGCAAAPSGKASPFRSAHNEEEIKALASSREGAAFPHSGAAKPLKELFWHLLERPVS